MTLDDLKKVLEDEEAEKVTGSSGMDVCRCTGCGKTFYTKDESEKCPYCGKINRNEALVA